MGFLDNIFGNKKKKIEADLQKNPTVAKVLELSSLYQNDGDITSALRLLRAWSKKFNDEQLNKILDEVEIKEREAEINDLQSRINDAPNPLNYSRLATLKIKSGELDDAMATCKESLEKFPQFNSGAHQCMGNIYLIREDYENAAKEYEAVIKEDSNNFQVVKSLCEIYIYNGNLEKAVQYLEDLIKHNPGDQTLKDMLDRAKAGEQLVENKPVEEVAAPIEEAEKIPVNTVEAVAPPPMMEDSRSPDTNRQISIDAKILVTDPEGKVVEIALESEEFIIGRHKNANLSIDDGKNFISRKHACIKQVDNLFQLNDMGSGNGTYLNDNKISGIQSLNDNDVIRVGYYTIVYKGPSSGAMSDDYDMTMIEDGDATIVGQEFSYLNQPATNLNNVTTEEEVQKMSELDGVMHVLVINSSGFPIHSISNDDGINDQMASALMSHVFTLAQAETDKIEIGLVGSCDIKTKTHSVFVYGCNNGSVVAVIGSDKCMKGQIDIEIQNLLKGV